MQILEKGTSRKPIWAIAAARVEQIEAARLYRQIFVAAAIVDDHTIVFHKEM